MCDKPYESNDYIIVYYYNLQLIFYKILVNAPIHNDLLRYYVVHKNYENLLLSETLGKLYNYTNELMDITANYGGKEWHFESFCKKAPTKEV